MTAPSQSRSRLRILLPVLLVVAALGIAPAQTQNLPPKPAAYFTDQANVVDADTGHAINEQLAQFERDTSNQILVAIYPNLPDQASPDQYSIDTFNSWHPGQKDKSNGAVLFVYVQDHKMFIVTGRGLEGALPDAICNEIVTQILRPSFRAGNYGSGIQAGVNAMIAATKGEYKGSGQTVQERQQGNDSDSGGGLPLWAIILIVVVFILFRIFFRGMGFAPMIYTGGGWGGGGFGGGGGGFGGGGGGFSGFSGGGGSSAGGGAGGGW